MASKSAAGLEKYVRERVPPMLTDQYQFTMAYTYWKSGRHQDEAVFELFFRENPFGGEFSLFSGLTDCLLFLKNFKYTEQDVAFLKSVLPSTMEEGFFRYLLTMDASGVSVCSFPEGSVVFDRVPLMEVNGPLAVVQLLETSLLCLVNYASLVSSNAARLRLAAGPKKRMLEMGLRRAQGPDGGLSASRYSYIGGFDMTSNMLAGQLFGIPVSGTMAHSYITSFSSLEEVRHRTLAPALGEGPALDLVSLSQAWLPRVCSLLQVTHSEVNQGELAAFISYALAFPRNFLVLLDSYSVMRSGVLNFCAVALALCQLHYQPIGVRLDSGDLCGQSVELRQIFLSCSSRFQVAELQSLLIVGSNNISEKSLLEMNGRENEIDVVGVGTHLVTCPLQPSLGCVYKLVQVNGAPRMKLTEDSGKSTLPGRKAVYRLYSQDGHAFLDLLSLREEPVPAEGIAVQCRVLGGWEEETVTAARVERIHQQCFTQGQISQTLPSTADIRTRVQAALSTLHPGQRRLQQPERYKVAVSEKLYCLLRDLKNSLKN
ncbi:nicotinate phosphoribosyltransferase isoform X3 [Acipenser oxyrinchus oxyrinchus]|uniref:Nicotinate phosphoribosyltransferase n=1 Tax=Acipenser oxyrinchus oxyrinchus TaxID=40147 RepID=A0AAD8GDF0_ACIOX|nr:nicotinate phosphoribosyltransferase isoform X3 [Acipenser oxyrinchus oxyrinchus]